MTRFSARALVLRVALTSLAGALSLILVEAGLRLAAPQYRYFSQPDERIGYSFIPGSRYAFAPPEGCPGWGSSGKINSHGLRDVERDYDKPAGQFRILALGDSSTEALQFELQQSWTQLLERRLNETSGPSGRRFEVINAGRSGMGTATEYLYFVNKGLRYKPDLVLLLFIPNDYTDNSKRLRPSLQPFYLLDGDDLVLDDSFRHSRAFRAKQRLQGLRRHSLSLGLVTRLRTRYVDAGVEQSEFFHGFKHDTLSAGEAEALEITRRLLIRLNEAVLARGARLVLVHGSSPLTVNAAQAGAANRSAAVFRSERELARLAQREGLDYLDLIPLLLDHSTRAGVPIHGCEENGGRGHWARIRHRLAAAAIHDHLRATGRLPAAE